VLAAVSGGADSVALLRSLHRLLPSGERGRIVVAHFNHRLRGDESEGDERFVGDLAASLRLECIVGRDVSPERPASENALREARYDFLTATAHEVGARYVAVGHTADDQAETILFRLLRGTSLSGLSGMPCVRPLSEAVTLVRPLLAVRRSAVRDYLASLGQAFRDDSSNEQLHYARNRLRRETIPQLENIVEGDVVENLLRLARQAEEATRPIRQQSQNLCRLVEHRPEGLSIPDALCEAPREVLREVFVELWRERNWPRGAMTFERWEELVELLLAPSRRVQMFPGGLRCERAARSLVVTRRPARKE
jgi:tRNA(Ile)-lysidine synthase